MSQTTNEPTVETIADVDLWRALVDGVNTVSSKEEAVFEFDTDTFRIRVKDAGNVALIRQTVDADDFEHYDVERPYTAGINTAKFEELLRVVDDDLVDFSWDWDSFKWAFRAGDVDGDISAIEAGSITGSPTEVPPVKDDMPYNVDVTLPVDKFKKASKVVGMVTNHATFRMGGEDGIFVVRGKGDIDSYNVSIHDDDRFEWRDDGPPASVSEAVQSNDYLSELVTLIDADTCRFVCGDDVPYHVWTTRAGCIDTKIMQAPRIPK